MVAQLYLTASEVTRYSIGYVANFGSNLSCVVGEKIQGRPGSRSALRSQRSAKDLYSEEQ